MRRKVGSEADRRVLSGLAVWVGGALLLLFVAGQIYLVASRGARTEDRSLTLVDFLSQGAFVLTASAGLLIVLALSFRIRDIFRERALRGRFPDAFLLTVSRMDGLRSSLTGVLRAAFPLEEKPVVPGYFTLMVDRSGLTFWSGWAQPIRFLTIPWSDVGQVQEGWTQGPIRRFRALLVSVTTSAGDVIELPFTFIGTGPLGILPPTRARLTQIEQRMGGLRLRDE